MSAPEPFRTIERVQRGLRVDHDAQVPVLERGTKTFRPTALWLNYERDCCPGIPGEARWQLQSASLGGAGTGAVFGTYLDLPEPYLSMAREDRDVALPLLAERTNGAAL